MRRRLAQTMRNWADRLDHEGAPKGLGWSFTFEKHRGIVFNEDRRGCPLWYYGDVDYLRAHDEGVHRAPRVDWAALANGAPETGTISHPLWGKP